MAYYFGQTINHLVGGRMPTIDYASPLEAQCQKIADCQAEVSRAYVAVSRGEKGAMARWNKANSDLAASHNRRYQIASGLSFSDIDQG
jgi:hypothetical protein